MSEQNMARFGIFCKVSRKIDGQEASEAAMHEARTALIEAFRCWLRETRPSREDAEIEAEGTGAVLRQIVLLETSGGNAA